MLSPFILPSTTKYDKYCRLGVFVSYSFVFETGKPLFLGAPGTKPTLNPIPKMSAGGRVTPPDFKNLQSCFFAGLCIENE